MVDKVSIGIFVINTLKNFFINGSFYHLWFIPALIMSMCVCYCIYKKKKRLMLYFSLLTILFATANFSYYYVGIRFPLLGLIMENNVFINFKSIICFGFPYFSLGYLLVEFGYYFKEKVNIYLILSLLGFVFESFFIYYFGLYKNNTNSLFLYALVFFLIVKLLNINKEKDPTYLKIISSFNYYFHALFIFIMKLLFPNIESTLLFLITSFSCCLVGLLMSKVDNKLIKNII